MGRPRPDPNALIRVFLYIDFNPMSFRPSGRNLFWCVKPDACPFARDPKQDLSSQGSLEMTAFMQGVPRDDSQWGLASVPARIRMP